MELSVIYFLRAYQQLLIVRNLSILVSQVKEHLQPVLLLLDREVALDRRVQASWDLLWVLLIELGSTLNTLYRIEYA